MIKGQEEEEQPKHVQTTTEHAAKQKDSKTSGEFKPHVSYNFFNGLELMKVSTKFVLIYPLKKNAHVCEF